MFVNTWPERSRRLFSCFDPVIQRVSASICLENGLRSTEALCSSKQDGGKTYIIVSHVFIGTYVCAVNQR